MGSEFVSRQSWVNPPGYSPGDIRSLRTGQIAAPGGELQGQAVQAELLCERPIKRLGKHNVQGINMRMPKRLDPAAVTDQKLTVGIL